MASAIPCRSDQALSRKKMYIDIDANDNLAEPCMATFKETGVARAVRAVRLWRDGIWQWCAITGWQDERPTAAALSAIEESGDGPALLLHGGNQGLRLAVITAAEQAAMVRWDVTDREQWPEPFLIIRPGTEVG